ncbi:MAG: DUF6247 family protein [Pseudonocardiaceae bacterium]
MAEPLPSPTSDSGPVPPAADPVAIRACLSPAVAAVFNWEWESVLEAAKQSKDLAGVHDLLGKWRHFAYAELTEPGWYFGLLAKAERILRTGTNPDREDQREVHHLLLAQCSADPARSPTSRRTSTTWWYHAGYHQLRRGAAPGNIGHPPPLPALHNSLRVLPWCLHMHETRTPTTGRRSVPRSERYRKPEPARVNGRMVEVMSRT